jgi:hypothetical protein
MSRKLLTECRVTRLMLLGARDRLLMDLILLLTNFRAPFPLDLAQYMIE